MPIPRKGRRVLGGCGILIVLSLAVLLFTGLGKDAQTLWKHGIIQAELSEPPELKYSASREANLKAIYVAMMLAHDSDGQFPDAGKWMDAIANRIRVSDMTEAEAAKKLVRPDLQPPKPGVYGYAMNDAASGKFKDDLKDPKTVLIYESNDTARNAHGDPKTAKGRMAVAIDGSIVKL